MNVFPAEDYQQVHLVFLLHLILPYNQAHIGYLYNAIWICLLVVSGAGQSSFPNFNYSAWRNPLGGFGTQCSNWGYRVNGCQVVQDLTMTFHFRINGVTLPVELIFIHCTFCLRECSN